MAGEPTVVYIAGTGAGKSLTFLLPACFHGYGQTIVIVPLAALRTDLLERCQALRIRVTVWHHGACDDTASIILATLESISHENFPTFVRRQAALGVLERIVVDEFHYVILEDVVYRRHLLQLHNITRYFTRITLLSATMPVSC
jgi:superfamily II DNA helicase RecQ